MISQFHLFCNIISFTVGTSKTSIPGLGIVAILLLAALVDDVRTSVGILFPLLLAGDLITVAIYRKHIDWSGIVNILPSLLLGVAIGGISLWHATPVSFSMIFFTVPPSLFILRMFFLKHSQDGQRGLIFTFIMGGVTGYASVMANMAGPALALLLLSRGYTNKSFLGMTSWILLTLGLFKLPLYLVAGLITHETLTLNLFMLPGLLIGACTGKLLIQKISDRLFYILVLGSLLLAFVRFMLTS